jgi:hypothetical protein
VFDVKYKTNSHLWKMFVDPLDTGGRLHQRRQNGVGPIGFGVKSVTAQQGITPGMFPTTQESRRRSSLQLLGVYVLKFLK